MTGRASSFGKRGAAAAATLSAPLALPVNSDQPEKENAPAGFFARLPWLTAALCTMLIFKFVAELRAATDFNAPNEPGHFSLLALGGSSRDLVLNNGEWWRLFTSSALHASPSHLIGNLIALAAAGFLLEPIIGLGWFAAIYFVCALAGALMSMMMNSADIMSVGASGAIMGCLAATYCLSFHDGVDRPGLMRRVAGFLLFPALMPAVSDGGGIVDVAAHFGGAVAGTTLAFAIMIAWPDRDDHLPGRSMAALLGGGLLALTLIAFVISSNSFTRHAEKGFDYIPPAEMPKTTKVTGEQSLALAEKYPNDPRAQFFRGLYFLQQNNLHDAEPRLREAIRLGEEKTSVMTPHFLNWARTALALDVKGLNRPDDARAIAAPLCTAADMEREWLTLLQEEGLCSSR